MSPLERMAAHAATWTERTYQHSARDDRVETEKDEAEQPLMGVQDTLYSLVQYADWCLEKRGYNGGTWRDRKAFLEREHQKWHRLRDDGYSQFSASALSGVLPDIDDCHRSDCSELLGLVGVGALPEQDVEDVAELADLDADTISRAHIYRGDPLSAVDNLGRAALASGALEAASMNPDAAWYFGGVAALHAAETGVRSYFKGKGKHLPSVASWLSSPSAMVQGAGVALSYPFRQRPTSDDLPDDIVLGSYTIGYKGND